MWRKDGTLEAEYNHKTGVGKMWHENGMLRWEYNHKTGYISGGMIVEHSSTSGIIKMIKAWSM